MPKSHVLIVAVDGLRASSLGAYGNTTYPTPSLDQFAAQSMLLDSCYAPSADLAAIYRATWQSLHPLREQVGGATASLPEFFGERGYRTTLITDDQSLLDIKSGQDFHEAIEFQPALADAFAAANDLVSSVDTTKTAQPQLVWLHSRGMYGPWLAPLELQQSLLHEGDPLPVEADEPPDFVIDRNSDADTAFRYGCAYSAQVMLLDECWKALLETIDTSDAKSQWLVVLNGVRGFPLGEHARIGGIDGRLHVEQLHVPWLLRFPDGRGRLSRHGQLTTHLDLLPTLREWVEGPGRELRVESREPGGAWAAYCVCSPTFAAGLSLLPLIEARNPGWRESLISVGEDARAIRTPNWTLRKGANTELYVRPDDRWEANDVADRCPEIASELEQTLVEADAPR